MDITTALGQSISRLRQEKGISQLKLSEMADLHLNSIQSIESGKYTAKITTLFQIARALDITASDLINEVEIKDPELPPRRS